MRIIDCMAVLTEMRNLKFKMTALFDKDGILTLDG